jgi:hypothetical protein
MLGACIGNTRRLAIKRSWLVPPILWVAVVGESGTLKTPALRLVLRALLKRQERALKRYADEHIEHEQAKAEYERARDQWKKKGSGDPPTPPEPPVCERLIVGDTTVEAIAVKLLENPRGLLLVRDELAGWLGSFDRYSKGRGDSASWLPMYTAEPFIGDRKTGDRPTIYVPRPALCIVGGIQPGILSHALGKLHLEDGLASRLLLTHPPRRPKRWSEADIAPEVEQGLAEIVDCLLNLEADCDDDGDTCPRIVQLTPDAKRCYRTYFDAHALEAAELSGPLAAAWSKLE